MSNRQKMSGIVYPAGRAVEVRLYLEVGSQLHNGTIDELIADLEDGTDATQDELGAGVADSEQA